MGCWDYVVELQLSLYCTKLYIRILSTLHYIVLYCTVLHCAVLYVLQCTVLYCTALYCILPCLGGEDGEGVPE